MDENIFASDSLHLGSLDSQDEEIFFSKVPRESYRFEPGTPISSKISRETFEKANEIISKFVSPNESNENHLNLCLPMPPLVMQPPKRKRRKVVNFVKVQEVKDFKKIYFPNQPYMMSVEGRNIEVMDVLLMKDGGLFVAMMQVFSNQNSSKCFDCFGSISRSKKFVCVKSLKEKKEFQDLELPACDSRYPGWESTSGKKKNLWCVKCIAYHNKKIRKFVDHMKREAVTWLENEKSKEKKEIFAKFEMEKNKLMEEIEMLKMRNQNLEEKNLKSQKITKDQVLSTQGVEIITQTILDFIQNDIKKQKFPYGRKTDGGKERKPKDISVEDLKKFDLKSEVNKQSGNLLFKILKRLAELARAGRTKKPSKKTQKKLWLMINQILSIAYKVVNINYNSKQNILVGLLINQLCNSDLIKTLLNHIGVSNSVTTQKRLLKKNGEKKRGKTFTRELKKEDLAVIWILDNIQKVIWGNSVSKDKGKSVTPVFTNLGYFISNLTVEDFNDCTRDKWNVDVLDVLFQNPRKLFEKSEDVKVFYEFFTQNLQKNLEEIRDELKCFGTDVVDKLSDNINKNELKYCPKCHEVANSNYCRKCKNCSSDLVSMAHLSKEKEKYEEFLLKQKLKLFQGARKKKPKSQKILKQQQEKVEKEKNVIREKLSKHPKDINLVEGIEENPGSINGLKSGLVRITENQNPTEQILKILFIDGDPMAKMINFIAQNRAKYKNYVGRNGLFHTKKFAYGVFTDFLVEIFPDLLAAMGWTTIAQKKLIEKVGNMHKCFEIFQIFNSALTKEIISFVCKATCADVTDEFVNGKWLLDSLERYYKSHPEFYFQWWFYKFLQYILMLHAGSRKGGVEGIKMIKAAVRLFIPNAYTSHHHNYLKIFPWELVEEEMMPKKLADELWFNALCLCRSGLKTEEMDGKFEFMNKLLKSLVNSHATYKCWLYASILFPDLIKIKKLSYDVFSLNDRFRENKCCTTILQELYVRRHIRKTDFFRRKFQMSTIDEKKVVIEEENCSSIESLLKTRADSGFKHVIKCIKNGKAISISADLCRKLIITECESAEEDVDDINLGEQSPEVSRNAMQVDNVSESDDEEEEGDWSSDEDEEEGEVEKVSINETGKIYNNNSENILDISDLLKTIKLESQDISGIGENDLKQYGKVLLYYKCKVLKDKIDDENGYKVEDDYKKYYSSLQSKLRMTVSKRSSSDTAVINKRMRRYHSDMVEIVNM